MILETFRRLSSDREQKRNTQSSTVGQSGLQISKTGHLLVIRPRCNVPSSCRPSLCDRGDIRQFTASSACRLRRYLRECLAPYSVLITLTYPHGHGFDGRSSKRDLKVFLQRLKRKAAELPGNYHEFAALWFMEFQDRGCIHYHILTTHRFPKHWIAQSWYEIVGSDDDRHLRAGTRIESIRSGKRGISSYAAKYAAKQQQKVVPEDFGWSGRFWGVIGWRATMSADTWLDADSDGTLAVERQLKALDKLIFSNKARGKCEIVCRDGGTYVIYMRSLVMEHEARVLVDKIESAIRLFRPGFMSAIFENELDDDEFEDMNHAA